MFSHKDVLPSGRILVFMITLGKTFFHLSVSTIIIASYCKNGTKLCKDIEIHQGLDIIRNIRYSEVNKRE